MENEKGIRGRHAYQEAIAFMSNQTHYYIETWNGCVKVNTMSLKDEPVEGGYGFDMNIKNYDKSNIYYLFNFFTYFGNWQLQSVRKYEDDKLIISMKCEDTVYLYNNYSMSTIMNFLHSVPVFTKYITLKDGKVHEHKRPYGKFIAEVSERDTEELLKYIVIE
jgi:hypothetical protein